MTLTYYSPGRQARGAGRAAAPSAGGNALGHRPDTVPGTTLYCPASKCVPPTLHTKITERDPTAPLPHKSPASPTCDCAATTCAAAHRYPEGVDFSVDPRVRRPTAITERSAHPPSPEAAKFGQTTYQMEVLQHSSADINPRGGGAAAPGPGSTLGSSNSGRAAATGSGSASAPSSPAHRPSIAATRPGYLTTSAAASAPVAERYAAAAAAGTSGRVPHPGGSSSAGSSPAAHGVAARSTNDSCSGSGAAACFRDPPALVRPVAGAAAAAAAGARGSPQQDRLCKDAVYLRALDQHSRGRLPGYTGHRPQHNVALELPPPSKLTTWGAASQAALSRPLPPNETSHGIKSSLLGFFSAGVTSASQGFVSENGLAEAPRYHESTRPLEGRMKIPQASATTRHGAKFTG